VQQAFFDVQVLESLLAEIPFSEVQVSYQVSEAEDRDWNEQWEKEGFLPIVIGKRLVVHDGRHLGNVHPSDFDMHIEIDAHLAFGTGTHETTQMMLATLLEINLRDCRVLDCGCGTGILGITALKAGASEVVGYDIDEWSADNARHNAVINRVDKCYTALLGDVAIVKDLKGSFDVVLANINRNILLADMPAFVGKLSTNGLLLLSGFYDSDKPFLTEKAESLGMQLVGEKKEGEWMCLTFRKL
jgi:ribosomal protein L11 methyltransferase